MTANKTTAIIAMMAVRVFAKYASKAADAQDESEFENSAEAANVFSIGCCIIYVLSALPKVVSDYSVFWNVVNRLNKNH